MTRVTVEPHGRRASVHDSARAGWNICTADIGFKLVPRVGVQFRTRRGGWYTIRIEFDNGRTWGAYAGYLPARALLTVRPDSPPPTMGLLRPAGEPSDFSGGGGAGIDACGVDGSVHEHDALMQRHPVGLYDMSTGKLRDARTIPTAGYYRITRGRDYRGATNKVACLPEFVAAANPADIYDDYRVPVDATPIPPYGVTLRDAVLAMQAFDGQHLLRAYRRALRLLGDLFVQDDLRAMLRECELAWDAARETAITFGETRYNPSTGRNEWTPSLPGIWHADVGREWAWVAILAATVERLDGRLARTTRRVLGLGLAARMRRIAKHVAHTRTGILQRFVEGMSGDPYPYGPYPASGVLQGSGIVLTQHLEACAQIRALEVLGMKREALKLAQTILVARATTWGRKWWNTDTGKPEGGGWHGPADDQAWPAIASLLRLDRRAGMRAAAHHKIPTYLGGPWIGPFVDPESVLGALAASAEQGKTREAAELLR